MSANDQRSEIEYLVEALDDVPMDRDMVEREVKRLGIDVPAAARRLRAKIRAALGTDEETDVESCGCENEGGDGCSHGAQKS